MSTTPTKPTNESYWEKFMNVEMAFWNQFANDPKNLSIKPKLSDENGKPDVNKRCVENGFYYKVKSYVSKKGEPYYKVIKSKARGSEQKPTGDPIIDSLPASEESRAHTAVNKEYSDGAKKGHQENVEMHKERMEMDKQLLVAIQNLTESINALIERHDEAKEESA